MSGSGSGDRLKGNWYSGGAIVQLTISQSYSGEEVEHARHGVGTEIGNVLQDITRIVGWIGLGVGEGQSTSATDNAEFTRRTIQVVPEPDCAGNVISHSHKDRQRRLERCRPLVPR